MRRNNHRIIAVLNRLRKYVHYLILVAEISIGLHQNFGYYLLDRMRIYYKYIVCITSNILKLTIPEEYYNRINWNAGILRKTLRNALNMPRILHNGIIETMLFLTIRQ